MLVNLCRSTDAGQHADAGYDPDELFSGMSLEGIEEEMYLYC
jgi:hypothetical protein